MPNMHKEQSDQPCDSKLLQGDPNFRDFGGLPTEDGRQVRTGILHRSGSLEALTNTDLESVRRLSIRLVCDLRSRKECASQPSRWPQPHNTKWLNHYLEVDIRAENSALHEILSSRPTLDSAHQMMRTVYEMLPAAAANSLGVILSHLANQATPVLIHCTAGKDRTGFICACILRALSVKRDHIYADYMLSATRIDMETLAKKTADFMGWRDVDKAVLATILAVSPTLLDIAFERIETDYGSFDAYLRGPVGLDEKTLSSLRKRLLIEKL